ncbi:MAG: hypothetical protein N3B01_08060, partial [Verrucomicrobiae bacterium]|nr:hypothetical protein [Verrucomicrobiae bacterium]
MKRTVALLTVGFACSLGQLSAAEPLSISGIYPHLTVFNGTGEFSRHGECGIGAVVPWAGRLWLITYPPHSTRGSSDKLYSIDPQLNLTVHPESVGGTHACRMIHRESNQLIIGPYFISADGKVRACDVKNKLIGRMTAVARHLTDPANLVYFYDMEGALYEVNVHTLDVKRIFEKPVPGWHGKGGYTAQGRLVIANNGEHAASKKKFQYLAGADPKDPEDAGVLAEWDGKTWRIVERRQFTDVTGPGDIYGAPDDHAPLWAIGWDKRSVILKLLDNGQWQTFRLPKGSYTYDPKHGWFTEWPRIRKITGNRWLMVMHGQMFDFPPAFSRANTGGLRPICTHLRIIPDFCAWDDKLVLAGDDTSVMQNPLAGTSQSNLRFTTFEELKTYGPAAGWGGVWINDPVKANTPSDPFLLAGYRHRVLHLSHRRTEPVTFTVELDIHGDGQWREHKKITVPADGYVFEVFPEELKAEWIRVRTDRDATASAFLHVSSPRPGVRGEARVFRGLSARRWRDVTIRPDANGRLQVFCDGAGYEVDERLRFRASEPDKLLAARTAAAPNLRAEVDAASVVLTDPKGKRWRLPKCDGAMFDEVSRYRTLREVQTERYLGNWHGVFYEVPRGLELSQIKPVAAHRRAITDFCSWRGLLVLAGDVTRRGDGHCFGTDDGKCALWFGAVDDLWRLG